MKRSHSVDRESRRNALKGMAVLGSAAALSATTSASAGSAPSEQQQSAPESLGYRETDHIREYYRRARF